ncbi:outer membrane lipoprotein-sorting protein [Nevskia sp.]|uniref:outer membrane lipoprotein-sorting protein n=1 Tax=Nevskia sp. TaxID=1929292 RepID=UPI0025D862B7|nr:outer membrane lipoprotein-sorting protein [Nevskia sp.]
MLPLRGRMVIAGLMLGLAVAHPAAAARSEAELRACLRANLFDETVSQDIAITQTDAGGAVKRLNGRWYWQRSNAVQRSMLKLTAPAELNGAAYLFINETGRETFWLYLPSVGKVRKVVGATVAQSLFGSGLSAFDLKFLFSGLIGGQFSYAGQATVGKRSGERWRYLPPSAPDILYDKVDLVIDDVWCLPIKADLYGGVPWKTLEVDPMSVSKQDGRWRAARVLLTDLRAGNRSEIRLGVEKAGSALPKALFDPRKFHRQP